MIDWPLPPSGPLAAAIAASQTGHWRDAIDLWRDLLAKGREPELAAAAIAEAAAHIGHRGLVDQMLGQFDVVPPELEALLSAAEPDDAGDPDAFAHLSGHPEQLVSDFVEGHALASLLAAQPETAKLAPTIRERRLERLIRGNPDRITRTLQAIRAERDMAKLRKAAGEVVEGTRDCELLHRAMVQLAKAGVPESDPLFERALARFGAIRAPGQRKAMAEARLARALGYPSFARVLLLKALHRSHKAKERGQIRRRLAQIAAERSRWLDDRALLARADFGGETPERDALLALAEDRPEAIGEPVEDAFAWLLSSGVSAQPYPAENRLLMVGNTLGCGGMERVLARSYRHFGESDDFSAVDLALLDFADGAPSAFYAEEAGIAAADIVLLGPEGQAAMPFSLLPGSWAQRAQALHAHIALTRPRVIHAWNDLTGLLAAFAGLHAGCPRIVVHFHHAPGVPRSGRAAPIASYPAAFRMLLDRPEMAMVFCSEASARGYAEWWRAGETGAMRVVPNGISLKESSFTGKAEARRAIGLDPERPVVGTVLRFAAVKQPLLWAEAAAALARQRPDAQFLLVGDGPLLDETRAAFASATLTDRAHFAGQVDRVAEYLAAMDLFWLTSRTEGLPNVLVEAQLAGVPVLTFDVGGAAETIRDGESGVAIRPGEIDELVAQSLALLAEPERLAAMGQVARAQATERFSEDRFYADIAAVYGGAP